MEKGQKTMVNPSDLCYICRDIENHPSVFRITLVRISSDIFFRNRILISLYKQKIPAVKYKTCIIHQNEDSCGKLFFSENAEK